MYACIFLLVKKYCIIINHKNGVVLRHKKWDVGYIKKNFVKYKGQRKRIKMKGDEYIYY